MKTALKILIVVVGVLVALVVAAAIIVPMVFDPNDYKARIAQIVHERTGRDVKIPGNIDLSVFPWLGVDLGKIELSNANGFGPKSFASIDQASVHVRVWPLLHKQIELGKVTLDGLTLRLARNKQGQNNWSDMADRMSSGKAQQPAEQTLPSNKPEGGFQLTSFQTAGVEIKNAQIFWDDAAADTHYRLQNFTLSTGKVALGKPFDLDSHFDLHANRPQLDAQVALKGTLNAGVADKTYSLKSLRLSVDAQGNGVPGGKQTLTLTGDATADLNAQTLALQNVELKGAGLTAHAQMQGKQILDAPTFSGSMQVDQFSPLNLMKTLKLAVPKTRDADALSKASLSSKFNATSDSVSFNDLKMALDSSHLTGKASVKHFSTPVIKFALAVDQLNADRYLPPAASPEKAGKAVKKEQKNKNDNATAGKTDIDKSPISLDALKGLNVAGSLTLDELTAMNLHMQNAKLTLDLNKGVLKVNPLAADLYGGQIRSRATISAQGSQTYAMNVNVSGVKAGPLLKDLTQKKAMIDGQAQLKLDLQSAGKTLGAARRALGGNGNFAFNNGAIKGFNLAQIVRDAKAHMTGQASAKTDAPQQTDFTALTGSFKIDKGILSNDDLNMKSPLFRVDGQGTVDLVQNTLDYEVKAAVVNSLSGQGGAGLADLKGLTIPIRLRGSLLSPDYRVDIKQMIKDSQSERLDQVKQTLQKKTDKTEKKLRDKARDKLKGFLQ
ncbi:MAG: AsmA family protein [Salinisphaera sp.]|jgi:AsmA protein|nr:AsmA family protein [Salinisphaera sp.]